MTMAPRRADLASLLRAREKQRDALYRVARGYRRERLRGQHARYSLTDVPWETARPNLGPCAPKYMVIGDTPTGYEELHRRPFVHPAGMVLRQLMGATNHMTLSNTWLTYMVKYRIERGSVQPTEDELTAFKPWLRAEWVAIGRPQFVFTVGPHVTKAVMGRTYNPQDRYGLPVQRHSQHEPHTPVWVFPTCPTALGLHDPQWREGIEDDWSQVGRWLDENHP